MGLQSPPAELANPYQSVQTFLFNLQEQHYHPDRASIPFKESAEDDAYAVESAVKLKQILDGKGIVVSMEAVPRLTNHLDSASRTHRYYFDPENLFGVYLSKTPGGWVFSGEVQRRIREVYAHTFRMDLFWLESFLSRMGGARKFLGIQIYKYMIIFLMILFSFLFHKIFVFQFIRVLLRLVKRMGYHEMSREVLGPSSRHASLFILSWIFSQLLPVVRLPVYLVKYSLIILSVAMPVLGMLILFKFVNITSKYLEGVAKKSPSTLDDQLVPLIRKTMKTFVVLMGLLLILNNLDIEIVPLLTGLSIGGLAFALAAQDTIKNFFGSLMIFIDKPFQVGHWITSGEVDGTVEEVGFRSTRVRTFRDSILYIPNGKLADSIVDNHGLRTYRRFYTHISITYETPPERIKLYVQGLKDLVDNYPKTRKGNYHIYLHTLSDSSLDIMFYIFFKVGSWGEELKARHDMLIQIVELANKLGVKFAFPTRTLHLRDPLKESSGLPDPLSHSGLRSDGIEEL